MLRGTISLPVISLVFALQCGFVSSQEEVKLPIRKVILYKHGVGDFERIGKVKGNARVVLRFKAADMSDLLKSLTVLDLGTSVIHTIAYE